jgi:hypothetical protein
MCLDFLRIRPEAEREEVERKFDKAIEVLMNDFVVFPYGTDGNEQYRLIDLECYWLSPSFDRPEGGAMPRVRDAGGIFLHRFGFDICFQSDESAYGGILVRGIKNINNGTITVGPVILKRSVLFQGIDNNNHDIELRHVSAIKKVESPVIIVQSKRFYIKQ